MSNTERQPSFYATWPSVGRGKSPTDELMTSLGHQDWSKTVIGNGTKTPVSTCKPVSASQAVGTKIADATIAGKFKKLAPESRQEIVTFRAANKWSQVDLNQRCSFPVNTIREIESGRLVPTIGQLNTLNRVLKTGLKLI